MKTKLLCAAVLVMLYIHVVSAIPHGGKSNLFSILGSRSQVSAHHKLHVKKDYTTNIITVYTTIIIPEVIIWVDGNGSIISTETKSGGLTSSTSSPMAISTIPVAATTSTSPLTVLSS